MCVLKSGPFTRTDIRQVLLLEQGAAGDLAELVKLELPFGDP